MFHPFKGTIISLSIVTSSYILISRHDHVSSFISTYYCPKQMCHIMRKFLGHSN